MLPYYALGGARFVLSADGLSATAHPGRTYRLGQTVEVDLAGVDESLRRVDFGLRGAPRRASGRPAGRAPHAAHKRIDKAPEKTGNRKPEAENGPSIQGENRNEKLALLILAAIAALPLAASAADANAYADVLSAYVYRGQIGNDEAVFQPGLDVAGPLGLGYSFWAA
jgi:hypothetical protein